MRSEEGLGWNIKYQNMREDSKELGARGEGTKAGTVTEAG